MMRAASRGRALDRAKRDQERFRVLHRDARERIGHFPMDDMRENQVPDDADLPHGVPGLHLPEKLRKIELLPDLVFGAGHLPDLRKDPYVLDPRFVLRPRLACLS
jgi:hypothetical protein